MTDDHRLLVDSSATVVTVTINRPAVLNALDEATLRDLESSFRQLDGDPTVRCVILTGAGDKAFAAGADVTAMASMGPRQAREFSECGHRLAETIERLSAPVIAAVNGFALGGGLEMALACDFIIASSRSKLGLPEAGLGVIPGFGGAQRLARRIGLARAREMLYSGTLLSAEEAARVGLVNTITEPADLMSHVRRVAEAIASRAPLAVADAKRALREGADLPLRSGLVLERELFAGLFATADQKEGMRAFLDKRPPKFEGR
jgi:enoyl-CoA hydratase